MEHQTVVTIDMDKASLQLAATAVIEHLAMYPPSEEDHTTEYSMGVQILFDCLRSSFV